MSNDSTLCMQAANDAGFQFRVKKFMTKAANSILGESLGGSTTAANHTKRVAYAITVNNGTASVYQYAVGVVNDSAVEAVLATPNNPTVVTDAQIENAVNSLFSDYAGYDLVDDEA